MVHHNAKDYHQRFQCIYCKRSLLENKWVSEFFEEKHYKKTICKCGKEARINVNFFGSGHDDWHKRTTIEKKIEIVSK